MDTEAVKEKYEPRILALLQRIQNEVVAKGTYSSDGVFELSASEYAWYVIFWPTKPAPTGNEPERVEVVFTIADSMEYEGTYGGIAFELDITSEAGEFLGSIAPYSYTPEMWIPLTDPDAIENRFALFEALDFSRVSETISKLTREQE